MNIQAILERRSQQLRQEGYARTLAHAVMAEHEFAWIEGAMRRAEAHSKIKKAIEHAAEVGAEQATRELTAENARLREELAKIQRSYAAAVEELEREPDDNQPPIGDPG